MIEYHTEDENGARYHFIILNDTILLVLDYDFTIWKIEETDVHYTLDLNGKEHEIISYNRQFKLNHKWHFINWDLHTYKYIYNLLKNSDLPHNEIPTWLLNLVTLYELKK